MSQVVSSPPVGTHEAPLRVVLVGRTGLDQSLRRESTIELLRAKDPFEAVGELATPIDEQSPRHAVVIIAPGTVTEDELDSLSRSLRRVDPGVCVVGLLESPASRLVAPPPERFGLDGWIVPPVSPGTLRLLAVNGSPPQPPTSSATPPPIPQDALRTPVSIDQPAIGARPPSIAAPTPPAPKHDSTAQPSPVPSAAFSIDSAPVQALLTGSDVVTACLGVLRADPRFAEIAFIPAGQPEPQAPARASIAVTHRAHTFGTLRSTTADESTLAPAAAWMANWLALREQQAQLRRAAFTDPLTGAWNRRYFDGFLTRAIAEAKESRRDLSLLIFDIDDFKRYNDRFGHAAGDAILLQAVKVLKSVVRANDKVCRIGGDEFAVIFHEPDGPREAGSQHPGCILEIARRFHQRIGETTVQGLESQAKGPLAISGGMATFPWDGHDAASLVRHADTLLLESKAQGKNVLRFGPGAARALGAPGDQAAG